MTASAEAGYASIFVPAPARVFGPEGRFEVRELLGSGGAGEVWLVWDHLLERDVAAKFMREVDGRCAVHDASAEARATARLKHDNIVAVYDLGFEEGVPYLLLEHLDGVSLNLLVGEPSMTPQRAVEILIDIVRGLGHAHSAGVLHLDLKPSNVFVEATGRAKILDFGVGSLSRPRGEARDSDPGPVVGTPLYMAPEQWGLDPVDARADLWAVGMVFYELLTGSNAGADGTPSFRLCPHKKRRVPPVAKRLGLHGEVDWVLGRCLAPEPSERFQAAWELRSALERIRALMPNAGHSTVRRACRY